MKPFVRRETTSTRQPRHEEIATSPLGGNEWFLPFLIRARRDAAVARAALAAPSSAGHTAIAQTARVRTAAQAAQVAPPSPRTLASAQVAQVAPPSPRLLASAQAVQATLHDDLHGEGEHKLMAAGW